MSNSPSERCERLGEIFHLHDLAGDEEEDTDGGEVDDPRGHLEVEK